MGQKDRRGRPKTVYPSGYTPPTISDETDFNPTKGAFDLVDDFPAYDNPHKLYYHDAYEH